jgi:hypothetical protein
MLLRLRKKTAELPDFSAAGCFVCVVSCSAFTPQKIWLCIRSIGIILPRRPT